MNCMSKKYKVFKEVPGISAQVPKRTKAKAAGNRIHEDDRNAKERISLELLSLLGMCVT